MNRLYAYSTNQSNFFDDICLLSIEKFKLPSLLLLLLSLSKLEKSIANLIVDSSLFVEKLALFIVCLESRKATRAFFNNFAQIQSSSIKYLHYCLDIK